MTSPIHKNEIPVDTWKRCRVFDIPVVVLLIALGTANLVGIASADNSTRPFKADFAAIPTGLITLAGEGIATHLGKFDIEILRQAASQPTLADPCVGFEFIIVTMTAANGDELWMDYTNGDICFDFSDLSVITFAGTANFVGTGGTGRFSDSTGNYEMNWGGEISALGVTNGGEIGGVIGY